MDENCHVEPVQKEATAVERQTQRTALLAVQGLGCPNCSARVRNSLLALHGVTGAYVDHQIGSAEVAFNPDLVSLPLLIVAVSQAGNDGRHEYRALAVRTW
jgi:copper chaperone CopZ